MQPQRSSRRNVQGTERDAEVDATPLAGQYQGNFAARQNLAFNRLGRPGMATQRNEIAVDFIQVSNVGKYTRAFDFRFAYGKAYAFGR